MPKPSRCTYKPFRDLATAECKVHTGKIFFFKQLKNNEKRGVAFEYECYIPTKFVCVVYCQPYSMLMILTRKASKRLSTAFWF